jgi:hypothetical protein
MGQDFTNKNYVNVEMDISIQTGYGGILVVTLQIIGYTIRNHFTRLVANDLLEVLVTSFRDPKRSFGVYRGIFPSDKMAGM